MNSNHRPVIRPTLSSRLWVGLRRSGRSTPAVAYHYCRLPRRLRPVVPALEPAAHDASGLAGGLKAATSANREARETMCAASATGLCTRCKGGVPLALPQTLPFLLLKAPVQASTCYNRRHHILLLIINIWHVPRARRHHWNRCQVNVIRTADIHPRGLAGPLHGWTTKGRTQLQSKPTVTPTEVGSLGTGLSHLT